MTYSLNDCNAFFICSFGVITTFILSVISNPPSLRRFCTLFINSRAKPSLRKSSVSSTSSATVRFPSLATSHPGISSLMISTSAASTTSVSPSTFISSFPLASSSAICSCVSPFIYVATPFISFPYFLPIVRKLHFTFFTNMPIPSTKFSSFTLTSLRIRSLTASICFFWASSVAGTIILCNGWRTFMLTFLRRANTIDVTFCAICIRISSSLSIYLSSATGYFAK